MGEWREYAWGWLNPDVHLSQVLLPFVHSLEGESQGKVEFDIALSLLLLRSQQKVFFFPNGGDWNIHDRAVLGFLIVGYAWRCFYVKVVYYLPIVFIGFT